MYISKRSNLLYRYISFLAYAFFIIRMQIFMFLLRLHRCKITVELPVPFQLKKISSIHMQILHILLHLHCFKKKKIKVWKKLFVYSGAHPESWAGAASCGQNPQNRTEEIHRTTQVIIL
jgi:hypothetical protein